MNDRTTQNLILQDKLKIALAHLDYSFKKVVKLPADVEILNEEMLQTWESFTIRFIRVCDIFLSRYVPMLVRFEDPSFSGNLHDFLNAAEKMEIISSAKEWLTIQELVNMTTHEYSDEDISIYYARLRDICPKLLAITF